VLTQGGLLLPDPEEESWRIAPRHGVGVFSVQNVRRCCADGVAGGERTSVSDVRIPEFFHRIAAERAVMQGA
jgi:hypothetical protein